MKIEARPPTKEEMPFVYNSWLKGFYPSHYSGPIQRDDYFLTYTTVINHLIQDGAKIALAVNADEESEIFGYIASDTRFQLPTVHWLYIKKPFRELGIARWLMKQAAGIQPGQGFYYTFANVITNDYRRRHKEAIFKPDLIRERNLQNAGHQIGDDLLQKPSETRKRVRRNRSVNQEPQP